MGSEHKRGAVAPVAGVQDPERIGKLRYRYWGIDMLVESTGAGAVSLPHSLFRAESAVAWEVSASRRLADLMQYQALTPLLDVTLARIDS